ncbi:MAG: hypothetical protein AAFU49_12840 [Pseudomonadota bacterium]
MSAEVKEIQITRSNAMKEMDTIIKEVDSLEIDEKEKKTLLGKLKAKHKEIKSHFADLEKNPEKKISEKLKKGIGEVKDMIEAAGKKVKKGGSSAGAAMKKAVARAAAMSQKTGKKLKSMFG